MFALKLVYAIASAILTSILLGFVVNLHNSKINYVKSISCAMVVGMLVVPLYVLFFFQRKVQYAILIDSVYFIGTDWMAFFVYKFAFEFTGHDKYIKKFHWVYVTLATIDTISLLVNNFTFHSFYLLNVTSDIGFNYWSLILHPIHYVHLAFCYIMVAQSFIILFYESIVAPFYYKAKYLSILVVYFLIIACNFYCYSQDFPFDFSILLYGIFGAYVSWCCAYKVPSRMILMALERINSFINDGIFYFNINNECIYVNDYVKNLFEGDSRYNKKYATEKIRERIEMASAEGKGQFFWREKVEVNGQMHSFLFEYEKLFYSKVPIGSFLKLVETTERDALIDNLKFISNHDSLTGIYNRNKFFEECNLLIKDSPDVERVMLVSNIQGFKLVNEVFGRKTGDQILKLEAEMIKKGAEYASGEYIYGRISEDKFAVFIRKTDFKVENFDNSTLPVKHLIKTSNYQLKINLGITETHGFFENAQMLYDEALMALRSMPPDYKQSCIFYNSELMEQILLEKNITNDFPDAIRSEQFKLQLQPIFDSADKCVGAEAFVYWNHPALGKESPQYFLKVLEDHSLIHVLDTYVIERAIKILKVWQDNGYGDKIISVNISTKDIYYMNIYDVVTGLVEKYGINPSRLYLEFKETLLTADAANAKKLLRNLQDFGIKVGIDNFGRGYSSLNLLKDVQANFLKIDMLFLSESENEDRSFKILKFIVKLAKTLNMTVISQGVEQQAQYDILQQLNCEYMQGFFYSKPMSITEFEKTYMA